MLGGNGKFFLMPINKHSRAEGTRVREPEVRIGAAGEKIILKSEYFSIKFRFLEYFFAHVLPYLLVTLLAHRRAGRTFGLFLISHNLCKKILANTNNPPRALTIFALKLWFINHNSQIFCENFDL